MKTSLKRAQIGKATGIDTTVKSATGPFRAFAPTWPMVMGWKNKTLSEADYTTQYQAILDQIPGAVWDQLATKPEQTLLCYCRDGWFCHTHLIIEYAITRFPERFLDGRTSSS